MWWKLHDPNFNHFRLIHPCDGQTDRQTDGWAIAYTRYSIYAVARNKLRITRKHPESVNLCQLAWILLKVIFRAKITSVGLPNLVTISWPTAELLQVEDIQYGGCNLWPWPLKSKQWVRSSFAKSKVICLCLRPKLGLDLGLRRNLTSQRRLGLRPDFRPSLCLRHRS